MMFFPIPVPIREPTAEYFAQLKDRLNSLTSQELEERVRKEIEIKNKQVKHFKRALSYYGATAGVMVGSVPITDYAIQGGGEMFSDVNLFVYGTAMIVAMVANMVNCLVCRPPFPQTDIIEMGNRILEERKRPLVYDYQPIYRKHENQWRSGLERVIYG